MKRARAAPSRRLRPRVLIDGHVFGEGPRWHKGRLYFSDMHARQVVAVDMAGKRETVASMPLVKGYPSNGSSGLGFAPDGSLLAVSMADRRVVRLGDGPEHEEVADLRALSTGHCNDMVVDSKGRFYVGNFGFDLEDEAAEQKPACIALVCPTKPGATTYGKPRVAAKDVVFPNGMVNRHPLDPFPAPWRPAATHATRAPMHR